jgi:hypothetical protein
VQADPVGFIPSECSGIDPSLDGGRGNLAGKRTNIIHLQIRYTCCKYCN